MKKQTLFIAVLLFIALLAGLPLSAKVIKVNASVSPAMYKGKCPATFTFLGSIRSNSIGLVQYFWKRSDGVKSRVKTFRFKKPGIKRVKATWTLGAAGQKYNGWEELVVIVPNKIKSNRANFTHICLATAAVTRPVDRPALAVTTRDLSMKPYIDPAAFQLGARIVQRYSVFKGKIRITGVIKNIGSSNFVSGPNQAMAYLYELPSGENPDTPSQGRVVAQREIRNLAAGASFNLIYERDWNSSSNIEGEFPNCYRLLIRYDPDIYMDGNEHNDDVNQKNNKKNYNGMQINDMLK